MVVEAKANLIMLKEGGIRLKIDNNNLQRRVEVGNKQDGAKVC